MEGREIGISYGCMLFWRRTTDRVRGSNDRKYNRTLLLTDRAMYGCIHVVAVVIAVCLCVSDLLETRAKTLFSPNEMKL